jgi:hypothetical protein
MSLTFDQSSEYLMKSISTIVTGDIYNVPNNTKQIDYPNITQYNMFDEKRLMKGCITFSQTTGLLFEIMGNY